MLSAIYASFHFAVLCCACFSVSRGWLYISWTYKSSVCVHQVECRLRHHLYSFIPCKTSSVVTREYIKFLCPPTNCSMNPLDALCPATPLTAREEELCNGFQMATGWGGFLCRHIHPPHLTLQILYELIFGSSVLPADLTEGRCRKRKSRRV